MQVPLEVDYRNVDKTEALESLIRDKVAKLEQVCNQLDSCRISVEKVHEQPRSGSPYRVRIDATVPPGHEIAVAKNPGEGSRDAPLETVIRDAFQAARRRLNELNERQHGHTKQH